jgi:hypothetical protein
MFFCWPDKNPFHPPAKYKVAQTTLVVHLQDCLVVSNLTSVIMSYQKIGKNLLFLVLISIQVCATGYIKQAELTTQKP